MRNILAECKVINSHSKKPSCGGVGKENIDCNIMRDISVLDPIISKMKGAPKRIKSGIEGGCTKRKRQAKKVSNLLSNL